MGQEGRGRGRGLRRAFVLHRPAGRAVGLLCFCRVPHSRSVPFLVDLRNVSSLLAIQWPPMSGGPSLLTAQLRDGPERGLAFPSARAVQPCPRPPSSLSPPSPPTSGLPAPQHSCPSLWPLRSCHRGYAISREVGDRRPHLQGLHPPGTPFFYSKALTVTWGLALASPSLWLPKGPASTEPQATDRGQGRGGQGARARAPAPQSLCICNAYVGPVHRHPAELRPFLAEAQGGCPCCWPISWFPCAL